MNLPCLITALPAESRPLIEHFKLQSHEVNGLKLYAGDNTLLLQTGIGKLAAAARTAALLQACPDITGLVNVGIAGSDSPLGTQVVAGCVEDAGSDKKWYPHLPSVRKLHDVKTMTVQTHDKPSQQYQRDVAFDMEAAGIFSAARGKLDSSAVQSIKIVSDNLTNSFTAIDKAKVHQWIASSIPTVETMLNYIIDPTLTHRQRVDEYVASMQLALHFTATQTHQLHRLATQHLTLQENLPDLQSSDTNAKALIARLNKTVGDMPLQYN